MTLRFTVAVVLRHLTVTFIRLLEDFTNNLRYAIIAIDYFKFKSEFVEVVILRIDFNEIESMTLPGMNNGTGTMSARMYNNDFYRIIPTAIHPGGSIGNHKQESGDDMNYIISGMGKAICDGIEEELRPGVLHICPKGSMHSIINVGEEDLVMLTIVVKK